ncbi:MAG TPA: RNB domain-containing ribonuclease [Micromonosporaceae bacterium]|nr:RNB domain-containing ribonuclease [Micromonosporaceae bacterium]
MSIRRVRAPQIDFAPLRRELGLPTEFPLAARREAEEAARSVVAPAIDHTAIPFVTIDPPTSRDLDQAVCLARRTGGGYRVWYAIADVAWFVRPGGDVDRESWVRGQTVYLPDAKVPLHPPELSEGAASLLPDQIRPAVVWCIDLDADGATSAVRLERAAVRSRAKLNYAGVQADVDADRLAEPIALLPEIGRLLIARGLARGAIDLPTIEQEIEPDGESNGAGWRLTLRPPVPVEEYNAQISLLTGASAAKLMLDGGLGLLRTMPPPRPESLDRLRAAAGALGIAWPDGAAVGSVIAGLDPASPRAAAFLDQVPEILRGAGYTAFDGALPAVREHSAVAGPYAHVTAPLRRLADRYATEVCLSLHNAVAVPEWVREALPKLPEVMSNTDRVASAAERGAVELVEAALLSGRIGETFDAAVTDVAEPGGRGGVAGGTVAIDDPPVRARCDGADLPLGERIRVRLVEADPTRRRVRFERADEGER